MSEPADELRYSVKAFVKGDREGFCALGLDNLLTFLPMSSVCLGVLGFSADLFFGQILPANAIGLAFGNLFYARQALHRDVIGKLAVPALVWNKWATAYLVMAPLVFVAPWLTRELASTDTVPEADSTKARSPIVSLQP